MLELGLYREECRRRAGHVVGLELGLKLNGENEKGEMKYELF